MSSPRRAAPRSTSCCFFISLEFPTVLSFVQVIFDLSHRFHPPSQPLFFHSFAYFSTLFLGKDGQGTFCCCILKLSCNCTACIRKALRQQPHGLTLSGDAASLHHSGKLCSSTVASHAIAQLKCPVHGSDREAPASHWWVLPRLIVQEQFKTGKDNCYKRLLWTGKKMEEVHMSWEI